jgi:hypothetical protein
MACTQDLLTRTSSTSWNVVPHALRGRRTHPLGVGLPSPPPGRENLVWRSAFSRSASWPAVPRSAHEPQRRVPGRRRLVRGLTCESSSPSPRPCQRCRARSGLPAPRARLGTDCFRGSHVGVGAAVAGRGTRGAAQRRRGTPVRLPESAGGIPSLGFMGVPAHRRPVQPPDRPGHACVLDYRALPPSLAHRACGSAVVASREAGRRPGGWHSRSRPCGWRRASAQRCPFGSRTPRARPRAEPSGPGC